MPAPRVSILVCTHNRADILRDTLDSLTRVHLPPGGGELIVVDNASSDHTPAVFEEFVLAFPMPARLVREEKLGLSNARNRGVAEADGEILAFLDDDAVCEPKWLIGLIEVYDRHPDAGCVGGRVLLDWKTPPPDWWSDSMNHHLSAVDYGDADRLTYPHYPYGASISFSRGVFADGRGFNPALGRRGDDLGGSEEMALCLRIEGDGGGVYYAPNSVVHHRAEGARANPDYLYRKSFAHGRSCARMEAAHFDRRFRMRKWVSFVLQGMDYAIRGRGVDGGCRWRYRAGYVLETLRLALHGEAA
ncbi:MAG: glycosyltransferase family 2 protein [Leptospirillia bacterium]